MTSRERRLKNPHTHMCRKEHGMAFPVLWSVLVSWAGALQKVNLSRCAFSLEGIVQEKNATICHANRNLDILSLTPILCCILN